MFLLSFPLEVSKVHLVIYERVWWSIELISFIFVQGKIWVKLSLSINVAIIFSTLIAKVLFLFQKYVLCASFVQDDFFVKNHMTVSVFLHLKVFHSILFVCASIFRAVVCCFCDSCSLLYLKLDNVICSAFLFF